MMRQVFAMTMFVLGLAVTAQADILAAGTLYGGPTQNIATCYLFNAGTGPVTIVTNQIFREGGTGQPATSLALAFDFCGVSLAPNSSCFIQTTIANLAAHACKFVLSPSAADVRGGFEIREGNVVLQSVHLR